jgi:hypothetical protein
VRGTIAGKGDVVMDSGTGVNRAMESPFEVNLDGSNTLRSRDSDSPEALRASFIKAALGTIAHGSAPRLAQSRSGS